MPGISIPTNREPCVSHDPVGELVSNIGRKGFVDRLLTAGKVIGGADFVSLFLYPNKDTTIFMGTASSIDRKYATFAADNYRASCYLDDPNRAVMFQQLPSPWVHTYMNRDDVPSLAYRRLCYDQAHIADRLSLVSTNRYGVAFSVSFYSARDHGTFSENSKRALLGAFPIIHAIAARHLDLAEPTMDLDGVLRRVQINFPELTLREAQVTAGVVAGFSAAEMGSWLGIAETSVITHRKRAYERLQAKDQIELVRNYHTRL